MVTLTPHCTHWAPTHPVPATSSASVGDSHRTGESRRVGALVVPVPAAQRARRACQGTAHVAISCCQALKGEQQPEAHSTQSLASAEARPCAWTVLSLLPELNTAWLSQKSCKEGVFLYRCSRGLADWSLKHKQLLCPAFCRSEVDAHPSNVSLPPQEQGDPAG